MTKMQAWLGTAGTSVADTSAYRLGTWFSVTETTTMLGFRIDNPGLVNIMSRYGQDRSARLFRSTTGHYDVGATQVAYLDLPDILPAGWSEHLLVTPYTLETGYYYCIDYNVHGDSGGLNDYVAKTFTFTSAITDRQFYFPTNAGVFVENDTSVPTNQYQSSYYGVDILWDGPSTFIEDFTGTNGAAWNTAKWKGIHVGAGTLAERTIQSNAGYVRGGSSGQISSLYAQADVAVDDFEFLASFVLNGSSDNRSAEVAYRVSDAVSVDHPGRCYYATANQTGLYLERNSLSNGGVSWTSIATDTTTGFAGGTKKWMRVRVVGDNHKVKVWSDGSPEPGTWQIDATDNTYRAGHALILGNYLYGTTNNTVWDDIYISPRSADGLTASDDFNRSNGALTTPWILSGLTGSAFPNISSNVVVPSASGAVNYVKWNTASATDILFSQANIIQATPATPYTEGGVILADTAGNLYQFSWTHDSGVHKYELYRNTAGGSYTLLSSVSAPTSGTISLRIERNGPAGTITCFANDSQVLQATSETTFDTQYPGFALYSESGGTHAQLDDWSGGDIVSGGATAPDQVTGLDVTQSALNTAALSWSAPSDGGSAITAYKIERAPDSSGSPGSWSDLVANTGNTNVTYNDTTATAGSTYWYRVSAINAIGTGTASTADSVVMVIYVPDAPSTPIIDSSWEGSIHAYLTSAPADNGTAISDYAWQWAPSVTGGFSDDFNRSNGDPGSNWVVDGSSPIVKLAIVSNAVTNPTPLVIQAMVWATPCVTQVQFSQATFSVTNSDYTNVTLQIRSDAVGNGLGAAWHPLNGGEYVLYKVVAGATTQLGSAVTGVGFTGTRTLRLEVDATDQLTLFVNGGQVLTYDTTADAISGNYVGLGAYRNDGGTASVIDNWSGGDVSVPGSWTTFTDGTSTSREVTVSGLSNGTTYYVRAAAVNAGGSSSYSSAAGPTTPAAAGTVARLSSTLSLLVSSTSYLGI